jgi:hypothetical protein
MSIYLPTYCVHVMSGYTHIPCIHNLLLIHGFVPPVLCVVGNQIYTDNQLS